MTSNHGKMTVEPGRPGRILSTLAAGLIPLVVGLAVHRQGVNLMDDGLWLLGSRTLADGGQLYRDLFSIYGPARYVLLLPFFALLGQSVFALAVAKAVVDGVAGAFGYWFARRLGAGRWAWLVPFGVVALGPVYPRYLAASVFAALVGGLVPLPGRQGRGWVLGAALGFLSLFGLDMAGYGGVILLAGATAGSRGLPAWSWTRLGAGFALVLVPVIAVAFVGGFAATVWWDTVVYPLTRFGSGMGHSWWRTFLESPQLHEVFAGLNTGEALPPLGPFHSPALALGWRLLFGLVWGLPLGVLLWGRRQAGDHPLPVAMVPLLGLAFAGWSTVLGRGDVDHLRLVGLGVLLLLAPVLGRIAARRQWAVVGILGCALVFGPRLGEQLWLAGNSGRASLVPWERDTAGIGLGQERHNYLEAVLQAAHGDDGGTAVAWPAQPGLVFLMAAPLATVQATLLAGEVRQPDVVIEALREEPPGVIILGRAAGLVCGVVTTDGLAPGVYEFLRKTRRQVSTLWTPEGVFRILRPLNGESEHVTDLPLAERVPGPSQLVRTGTSPVVAAGTSAAQSVRVTGTDLSGLALLVGSPGPWPQHISLVLTVLGTTEGRPDRVLGRFPFEVDLKKQADRVELEFEPVPGSRGELVILDIAGNTDGQSPFTLFWHKADQEDHDARDFYPDGQAFWNHEPIGGDLFFVLY